MVKIYMASKMHHAEEWRDLYSRKNIHVVSRWPFLEPFVEPSPGNAVKFWEDDLADIARCDALVLYGQSTEKLRGALVEAGIALALGKLVMVIGEHDDYGTWRYHPRVMNYETLEGALSYLISRY
jgi:nucleoside 2-deoxyribosyltransferase